VEHLKVKIGEVFRVSREVANSDTGYRDYEDLTRGRHRLGADIQKGIFFYGEVPELNAPLTRTPAFIFHSNAFKRGSEDTPWADVIEPDRGYALFHGDNKQSSRGPLDSRGNAKFVTIQKFYSDPSLRKYAPPIMLFRQHDISGNRKGYRQFCGYGVPIRSSIVAQREHESDRYFTNLLIEIALFHLDRENEQFDWTWIDARRDSDIDADEALKFAPYAWRQWVDYGNDAVENCRRRVARQHVVAVKEQCRLVSDEQQILSAVIEYYEARKHAFEGLASFVTQQVIGPGCKRGWVTKRSGDGGIDFVCRVDIGNPAGLLSRAPIVVLGQAKCHSKNQPTNGQDLARVVARLQRGWIGAFVTTSYFSRAAQLELREDKYPLILINGQRLARILQAAIIADRIALHDLLDRETHWYERHIEPVDPGRIVDDEFFSTDLDLSAK
jgi:hypothetical protein